MRDMSRTFKVIVPIVHNEISFENLMESPSSSEPLFDACIRHFDFNRPWLSKILQIWNLTCRHRHQYVQTRRPVSSTLLMLVFSRGNDDEHS